jgi:hypothetical protein
MTEKDYRTWWRKGHDVHEGFRHRLHYGWVDAFYLWKFLKNKGNEKDCIVEQLWAEKEGLT